MTHFDPEDIKPKAPIDGADRYMGADDSRADIVVYSLGWCDDHARRDDEPSNALVHSRIFVNGVELARAYGITVDAEGGDFVRAKIGISPTSVRFAEIDIEDWERDDLPLAELGIASSE